MLTIPGPQAHSPFRVSALASQLNQAVNSSAVLAVRSVFVHYVDVVAGQSLDESQNQVLAQLLTYGQAVPAEDELGAVLVSCINSQVALPADTYLIHVIPRPGTISPWSSKATDIASVCDLGAVVARIERGVSLLLKVRPGFPLASYLSSQPFLDVVHDRMTERAIVGGVAGAPALLPEASFLFDQQAPRPLQTIQRARLAEANKTLGLALDAAELKYLEAAFPSRDPTDVEVFMFAQVNSEHCRHKVFNSEWTLGKDTKPNTLFGMIRNTHAKHPEHTVSAYSDNAAVLEGPEGVFYAPDPKSKVYTATPETVHMLVKVETHNHPTAVSPFAGAATGSGGEIRDEAAVGRGSRTKAGLAGFAVSDLHIPGFEQPWEVSTSRPAHVSSPLNIMLEAPLGSAAFNNEFGRPALAGYFRTLTTRDTAGAIRGYNKPIMLAGGLGAVRPQFALKDGRRLLPGSALIVLGGPAMLIGLGGGAASSVAAGNASADLDFASVQRGNPEMQRRAQMVVDACVALGTHNPIQSIHDVGAGGLSNALTELVHDNGLGARFELRDIPSAERGLSPLEIWCCEAQERYVLGVAPGDVELFRSLCERERAPFAVVGVATSEQRLVLADRLNNNTPIDMDMSALFDRPPKQVRTDVEVSLPEVPELTFSDQASSCLDRVLTLPSVGSKSFLITIGDRTVTGLVARDQMVGPWQTPVADVAVTLTSHSPETKSGEAMAMGERPTLALLSGPASARMATAEALLNLSAAHVPLSRVRLSANWMAAVSHAGEGSVLYAAVEALGLELCPTLGVSIPVGKDSTSMQMRAADGSAVTSPVSVVITAFAGAVDVRHTWTPQLVRRADSVLVFVDLALGHQRLGGSALAQVYGQLGANVPDVVDVAVLKAFLEAVEVLHETGLVLAYHDRSDGGLVTTVLEMAFAGRVGLSIDLPDQDALAALFNEELGAVFQIAQSDLGRFTAVLTEKGVPASAVSVVGHISEQPTQPVTISVNNHIVIQSTRSALQQTWAATSHKLQRLRDNPKAADQEYSTILDNADPGLSFQLSFELASPVALSSRPQVAILREQGVNGHVEMAYSFERAGFTAVDVHMTDLVSGRVSLDQFVGLAACGGFSYGDVLGAGAGWAKSVLFSADLRAQFSAFFGSRKDTFALGVCNGCQFFSQLKSLIPGAESWPSFERNASEQYEGRVVMVEVTAPGSVFLADMTSSRLPIAVAHGEGRAQFASGDLAAFNEQSLGAVRYVDNYGKVTEKYPYNPNGSPEGLAGVRTPNGRVLALMPHPERTTTLEANSWYPRDQGLTEGPWLQLFRNARRWVG